MIKKVDITKFNHKIKLNVRLSDLDALAHVNNATYLTYLEEARIAYFNDVLKFPNKSLAFGAVIGRIEIDYLNQVELGDRLEVYTRVSRLGIRSAEVKHVIVTNRGGELIPAATAITKMVSYDYENKKTVPIPENIKEIIKNFEKLN